MNELEQIKSSVDLCNQRDILIQEINEGEEVVNAQLPTVEEYKKMYFSNHAPRILFLILSIIIGFGIDLLLATNDMDYIGLLMLFLVPVFIYNVIFKNLYLSIKSEEFKKYAYLLSEAEKEQPVLVDELNKLKRQLSKLESTMRDEENCIIPEMYWDNANMIYSLIINKRAYDLVSAINKFEDIMHQIRTENMALESLEWQRISAYNSEIAAENSRIAAENSRQAAVNSGISAAFSIANYVELRRD